MKYLKVGSACVNQTPLDWDGNLQRLLYAIQQAQEQGVEVLCLPELSLTGYGCEDQFLAPYVCDMALAQLDRVAAACDNIVVAVGLPLRHAHAVWNTVALIVNREVLGYYVKQNLAGDGIHYEPRWFKAWKPGKSVLLENGRSLGDVTFEIAGVKIGFEICEDAWVADRPGRRAAGRGCDLILNPSASHFSFGKQDIRRLFVKEGSRSFSCTYLYANLQGNEAGRAIYDGGAMIAHNGALLAESPRLTFHDTQLVSATVDLSQTRLQKAQLTSNQPLVKDDHCRHYKKDEKQHWRNSLPTAQELTPPVQPATGNLHLSKEEEFTRAVCLALYDYMRKSYSRGFIVSLSGGADSAAVSCLVALMRKLAVADLGEEGFNQALSYLEGHTKMPDLLFTAYQSTANSGKVTLQAAEQLATALGAVFQHWNVTPLLQHYHKLAESAIERPLSWAQDDLTLQNVQARVRAPGIWMMANLRGALLLSTSNRSEAAVGYATMDGDTCGGVSPIAGIDKAFLRHWLRWLEKEGGTNIPPIPALKYINAQQPTAELRPAEQNQTDEEDLMPYPVLDEIERLAIRDKKSPAEVYTLLAVTHPEATSETRKKWVRRFFTLWSRNQWKRERYAPSFHLDDKNLDPKTWCRFPILSGAFQKELEDLNDLV